MNLEGKLVHISPVFNGRGKMVTDGKQDCQLSFYFFNHRSPEGDGTQFTQMNTDNKNTIIIF